MLAAQTPESGRAAAADDFHARLRAKRQVERDCLRRVQDLKQQLHGARQALADARADLGPETPDFSAELTSSDL